MPEPKNKSKNNIIIALLAVLIIAVLCVGGYFIIKDLTKKDAPINENNTPTKTEPSQPTPNTPTTPTDNTPAETTPNDNTSTSGNLNAGITYAERRGNDFYIEAQVEGAVNGTCTIYLIPSNGSESHVDTDDLEIHNKVSLCDEDFSLKGNSAGQHTVRVIVEAFDGRTTTLEKIVNID